MKKYIEKLSTLRQKNFPCWKLSKPEKSLFPEGKIRLFRVKLEN